MIRLIMRMTGGETDVSKEVEYTDWVQVGRFAHEFAGLSGKMQEKKALLMKNDAVSHFSAINACPPSGNSL